MATTTATQLLKVDEKEFDASIQEMSLQSLLNTISVLQKEMGREQANFNSLSNELGGLKKNSGQYKSISKDMAKSQTKLTIMMNRSMKCFAQQGNQQAKATVARKNSLKETQRSDVRNRHSADLESRPVIKVAQTSKSGSPTPQTEESQGETVKTSYSFSDAMSKFGGKPSQNGNHVTSKKTTVIVSSANSLSQNSSDSASTGSNYKDNKVNSSNNIGDKPSAKTSSVNVTSKPDVHEVKATHSSSTSKDSKQSQSLGPLANQKSQYMSKSMDTALNSKSLEPAKAKPDVVQSSQPGKQRSILVMNADKQVIDLDTFTERRNMLDELKKGKKDLKSTATNVKVERNGATPSVENITERNNSQESSKTNEFPRGNLLGDIKKGKKLSEVKDSKITENGSLDDRQGNNVQNSKAMKGNSNTVQEKSVDELKTIEKGTEKTKEVLKADASLPASAELSETGGVEDSEDSEASEASEDDKFITEFKFPGISVQNSAMKSTDGTKPKVAPPNPPQASEKVLPSSHHGNQVPTNKDGEELVVQTRVNFIDWDPDKLLAELYKVVLQSDNVEDISHKFIGMEGLMEKLPMNKKKATLLKTWKRRFFQAKDGWLHYYESSNRDKPSDSLQLMGGKVEELGPRVLGIDDGRGKYLMVRVPTDNEFGQWKVALESQTADNVKATYVRPSPASPPHKKKVIIIDIGSCGIRAGILTEKPTLPSVFFPSVVAVNKQTGEIIVGPDALRPNIRKTSTIHNPIRPTNKVDKFNIDMQMMTAILKKAFAELGVKVSDYLVMLSTPQNLGDTLKGSLMKILVDEFHVRGVCMVHQCLLALYSYNAMSGIIVDIGERLEILPIYDGVLIEGGVSRQAYGGEKILDSLYISLLENRYRFNTPVEKLLVRYLVEKGCYVAEDYKAAKAACDTNPAKYRVSVDLQDFFLPDGGHRSVTLDHAFFKAPEGFFNTDLWEMDYKNLQKQIFAAIQQCPMDSRKQMYRSVYLSGGVTMIPGFADRLQAELRKLAPPSAVVEVHASPQRYHSAYLGACSVAGMDVFEMSCVSADEWKKLGVKACKKWGM